MTTNDAGRETLQRIADAIDAGELTAASTMRAGIAGALGALSEPAPNDEQLADASD